MAEITLLGKGHELPKDQDWILVQGTASGFCLTATVLMKGVRKIIRREGPFASIGDATVAAQKIAATRGIVHIFMRGTPHA